MVQNIPSRMSVVDVVRDGTVESLTVDQRVVPTPLPQELLVKVA